MMIDLTSHSHLSHVKAHTVISMYERWLKTNNMHNYSVSRTTVQNVLQLYMYQNSKVRDQSSMLCDQLLRSTLSAHRKNDIARKLCTNKKILKAHKTVPYQRMLSSLDFRLEPIAFYTHLFASIGMRVLHPVLLFM